MNPKIKHIYTFRYAFAHTIIALLLLFIVLKTESQLVSYFSLLIFFALSYWLINNYARKTDNILINNLKQEKNGKGVPDIKNLAEWTEQTNKEIAQLKANEQFRKEFIGNVAHELKTPIFNIQGFIETLINGAMNDPEVNMKYLDRTQKNVQRLITLVKDLDTISKLETGQLKPDYSIFTIAEVVNEVFDILSEKSQSYGVSLEKNIPENLKVYADKEKITEVIHNLVLNSIIYGRKNGKTHVSAKEDDKTVVIEVQDNGIGIDEKHLAHIFERFYRVDKSRSRERGGSGLGLSIVKHIIDSHNQKIDVKSKANEGTTFYFTLQKAEK